MKRRHAVLALAAAVGALVLAACGAPAPHVPTAADLVVEQLNVVPAKVAPGDAVAVAFAVYNQGETAAAASVAQVLLGASADGVDAGDVILTQVATPALDADSSTPVTVNVTIPADAAPGAHYLWVVADALDEAGQEDRGNDAASHALAVEYLPCTDPTAVIQIADANLEAAVRGAIGVPTGSISCADMRTLVALSAPDSHIERLDGLQHASDLTSLDLPRNDVADLSPIENLVKLEALWLYGNQVSDLGPLEKLTAIEGLSLENNHVSDIGSLSQLTSLRNAYLGTNDITDLSPLQALPDLEQLYLWDNLLTDLAPLVANPGVDAGDQVDVSYNCLDTTAGSTAMQQLEALAARGVTLVHTAQKECEL